MVQLSLITMKNTGSINNSTKQQKYKINKHLDCGGGEAGPAHLRSDARTLDVVTHELNDCASAWRSLLQTRSLNPVNFCQGFESVNCAET